MPSPLRIQNLPAAEMAALLARDCSELTKQQVSALREFIEDIGGIENAYAAIEMLSELENTA